MGTLETINLAQKLEQINSYWSPRLIGELNGQHVRIAKVQGQFVWHTHEDEDELFLVLSGTLVIHLRDQADLVLQTGEMAIIPRGVAHQPEAESEAHILLFEPASTLNTGDQFNELTVRDPERL